MSAIPVPVFDVSVEPTFDVILRPATLGTGLRRAPQAEGSIAGTTT